MSIMDRKKWGAFLEKWTPFFIIACTFMGGLGSFLIYLFQGEFSYEVFIAGLIVVVILTLIEVIVLTS
ncbi:hypothetical protein JYK21_00925 [Ralstonia pickettii]|nr:hypothetical protein [Ralstonia pickettii]